MEVKIVLISKGQVNHKPIFNLFSSTFSPSLHEWIQENKNDNG
jgi:hypothetical protein